MHYGRNRTLDRGKMRDTHMVNRVNQFCPCQPNQLEFPKAYFMDLPTVLFRPAKVPSFSSTEKTT